MGAKRGMKRSPLRVGAKSLARGSTFKQRYARQLARGTTSFTASNDQRAKARDQGCRLHGAACGNADPAHIVSRALGGCDQPACVIGLCRHAHRAYDEHELDILGLLTLEEQAHAVAHLGIARAYRRLTGQRGWAE